MATDTLPVPDPVESSGQGYPIIEAGSHLRGGFVRRRWWPIALTVLFIGAGMAFLFEWNPLVHHSNTWATGGDLWGIYRAAHYVGWGYLGGIYTPGNGVVAFPGMSVLLAPVAMLTGHLNMSESFFPFFLPRPTAALVLMPVELLLASSVIFGSDALGERLGVARTRRMWLCTFVAIVAWPTVAAWGHAEDDLAMTFALYAIVAMLDRNWSRMGWLLGFGIVMQPLVGLMLPLFLGATPQGQRIRLAARSVALSLVLVGVALAGNFADTLHSLVEQPTPPSLNHATPWAAFAPKLNAATVTTSHLTRLMAGHNHHFSTTAATVTERTLILVSGGAGRLIDVLLAILLGIIVWRRPQPPVRLIWLAALVLASRCFFEPVMTPYYLSPPLILCLVLASRQGSKRFWSAAILSLEIMVFAYHHLNPWVWWIPVVTGLGAIVALGYPVDLNVGLTLPEDSVPIDVERVEPSETEMVERLEPALIS
jgi:hypothetical protein